MRVWRKAKAGAKLTGARMPPHPAHCGVCKRDCSATRVLPMARKSPCSPMLGRTGHPQVTRPTATGGVVRDWFPPNKYRAPKKVKQTVDRKLKHAVSMLRKAERRMKRANTAVKKWKKKVRYYNLKADQQF